MKMTLRIAALAGALALSAQPALAADAVSPVRAAMATALVEKLEFERVLDKLFDGLKGLFAANVIASMERDDKSGQMGRFFQAVPGGREHFATLLGEEFLAALRKRYPDFKKAAAQEYASTFTEDELRAVDSFFSSGAGEKWLRVSPQIEQAMGKWGEAAGMKAGVEAVSGAMNRVEAEQKDKGSAK